MGRITNAGLALLAAWMADHDKQLNIRWMGLGDQNKETYTGAETAMTHEKWHGRIERIYLEPGKSDIVRFEGLFRPDQNDRDWTIREVALFAEDRDYPGDFDHAIMVWIAQHPDSAIPTVDDTTLSEVITVPIQFTDSTIGAVNLVLELSPAELATVRDLMQMTLASVSYASWRDLENAEMIGLIRARLAEIGG